MYFDGITTLEELKKIYRELAFANHPDRGGDTVTMQAINAEFDVFHARLKDTMTGADYRQSFYEEMGWTGENYRHDLSMADLVKIIREYCKGHYPDCKFSVTRRHYDQITVALMEAPFEAIDTAKAGEWDIERFGESYGYDHSDVMHDYFDRSFYLWVEVGKWDKPFKVNTRTTKRSRTRAVKTA